MLTSHIAMVAEDSKISLKELTAVAAALQKQVSRDFGPIWGVQADVSAFANLEDVPLDYWPVVIKDDIADPDAAGYHEDKHGQPFSLVLYEKDWTLTASHEVLEMLGDPFGRRMIAGQSPQHRQGRVRFLVEVCDPCEDARYAYAINGVVVSDFYTPHYFDPVVAPGVRYSYQGAIQGPHEVLKGGYLSWYDPASRRWHQQTWFGGAKAVSKPLEDLKITNGNARAAIDRITQPNRARAMKITREVAGSQAATLQTAATFRNRSDELRAEVRQASRRKA